MPQYRVRFLVPAEVIVEVEADDEDTAADEAWTAAQNHLPSLAVADGRGVQVFADLDGIGAEAVDEQAGPTQPFIHPSLDEFQRHMAFTLTPEPVPPHGGYRVKGMAFHAVCGNPISSKMIDDPRSGEYGCRECGTRGFLAKP
jgi:hypothetical protein